MASIYRTPNPSNNMPGVHDSPGPQHVTLAIVLFLASVLLNGTAQHQPLTELTGIRTPQLLPDFEQLRSNQGLDDGTDCLANIATRSAVRPQPVVKRVGLGMPVIHAVCAADDDEVAARCMKVSEQVIDCEGRARTTVRQRNTLPCPHGWARGRSCSWGHLAFSGGLSR